MFKLEAKNTALPKLKATQADLEAALAELEATQADLEAAQTKLEALQANLETSQADLETSHADLETSHAELEATQAELEATEAELETTQAHLETSQLHVTQLRERLQELKRQQVENAHSDNNLFPDNDRPRFLGWFLLPMRVFLGLTFIYAGIQKLTDPQFFDPTMPGYIAAQIKGMAHGSPIHDFLINVALPHAVLFGWMTALGEIAIGLGMYAGFLFRPAAFFGMLLSLTFFLSASWNTYPYFFGSDIVFVFCWITMILSGPLNTGLASLDDWLVEQLLARSRAGQQLPLALQFYILLVVAGAPHKSYYADGISLLQVNPIIARGLQTQEGQMTRRVIIQDWAVGAITVAGIALLGIPLRIFSGDPNANIAETTTSTISPASIASTPEAPIAPEITSTPETIETPGSTQKPEITSTPEATKTPNATQPPAQTSPPRMTQPPVRTSTPIPQTLPPSGRSISIGQTIAPAGALQANASYSFVIASSQDNALLIHLPNGNFVAYDATCTHQACTVAYVPNSHILACPCHGSQYDPTRNGAVIQGPARLPLSALGIQIDNSTGAIKLTSVPS